jgi:hypothetical protein
MSLTPIPARRSSAAASSTRTRLSRGAGKVSRFGRSSSSGAPQPTRSSAASASSRCPTSVSSTSRIWPPTRSLSSLPVPFRNHAAVVDDGDLVRELIRFFEVLRRQQESSSPRGAGRGRSPRSRCDSEDRDRRRLVEEEHARLREQARREIEPSSHAARVSLRGSVGGVDELEALEQLRRAAAGLRAREAEQAPEHHEVLAARQQLVDGCELTGQREKLAHARRLANDVLTQQLSPSRVRLEQRCQDPE